MKKNVKRFRTRELFIFLRTYSTKNSLWFGRRYPDHVFFQHGVVERSAAADATWVPKFRIGGNGAHGFQHVQKDEIVLFLVGQLRVLANPSNQIFHLVERVRLFLFQVGHGGSKRFQRSRYGGDHGTFHDVPVRVCSIDLTFGSSIHKSKLRQQLLRRPLFVVGERLLLVNVRHQRSSSARRKRGPLLTRFVVIVLLLFLEKGVHHGMHRVRVQTHISSVN